MADISTCPGSESLFFVVHSVPKHILVHNPGQRFWVLDRSIVPRGTVVPQTLPQTVARYLEQAELQMPIFFESSTGTLGLSLDDASNNRCHTLLNALKLAPLGGKWTSVIRIAVSDILGVSVPSFGH
jgi:hypothetical protein